MPTPQEHFKAALDAQYDYFSIKGNKNITALDPQEKADVQAAKIEFNRQINLLLNHEKFDQWVVKDQKLQHLKQFAHSDAVIPGIKGKITAKLPHSEELVKAKRALDKAEEHYKEVKEQKASGIRRNFR